MEQWKMLADYEITGEIVVSNPQAASTILAWLRNRGEYHRFSKINRDWQAGHRGEFMFELLDGETARTILRRFRRGALQPTYAL